MWRCRFDSGRGTIASFFFSYGESITLRNTAVTYQEYDTNGSDTEYRWVRRHGIAVAWVPASY